MKASSDGKSLVRHELGNGLRVIAVPLPHLQTATLAVFVKVGSRHETVASNGLSHFLEHMLFRGTESHPSTYELNLAIEELGGTLDGATHTDSTLFQVTLPNETALKGFNVLDGIFRCPIFGGIEVEKRIIREEILEGLDEEGNDINADDVTRKMLFAPHPLGHKILGSDENVAGFEVADLRRHMGRFYGASNMVLCVAGGVSPHAVLKQAERHFGDLEAGQPSRSEAPASNGTPESRFRYVPNPGSQTEVRACFPAWGETDGRATGLRLISRILDDGLSSRVHRRICDERGLAYEAFASYEPYEDSGVFDLGATVEHAKAPIVLGELLKLAQELRSVPVPEAELDRSRRRHGWDLRTSVDDGEALVSFYGHNALIGRDDSLDERARQMREVTSADIQKLAAELFHPERLHVACIGTLENGLEERTRAVANAYR